MLGGARWLAVALNGGTNYAGPFLAAAICGIINVFYVVFGVCDFAVSSVVVATSLS